MEKNYYLYIEAPEELGSTYNYEAFLETEQEAIETMKRVSDSEELEGTLGIGDPALGSELQILGFEGMYEMESDTGWFGALYKKRTE